MVEVAPQGGKLVVPAFKYILFLIMTAVLLFAILCCLMSSNLGARSCMLESGRRYMSVFSAYRPSVKAENNLEGALRIHAFERADSCKFYVYVSATNTDGSAVKTLDESQITFKLLNKTGDDAIARIKTVKPLSAYSTDWTSPMSFASVIDNSGSMFNNDVKVLEKNYETLLNGITTPYNSSVVKFSSMPHMLQSLTDDKARLIEAVKKPISRTSTALFDALDISIDKLKARPHLKFAILATDGNDNESSATLDSIVQRCGTNCISLFIFGFGWLEVKTLNTLADKTDGYYAYVPNSSNLDEWFTKVTDIINNVQVLEVVTDLDMALPGQIDMEINVNGSKLIRTRNWN